VTLSDKRTGYNGSKHQERRHEHGCRYQELSGTDESRPEAVLQKSGAFPIALNIHREPGTPDAGCGPGQSGQRS